MPQLRKTDLRTPFGPNSSKRVRARIDRHTSTQAAAATLTDVSVVELAGDVQALILTVAGIPAAGESLTVDVQKNGVTILSAPVVIDSTVTVKQSLLAPLKNNPWKVGDILTVIRTYVAGGGPTPIGPNRVTLEIA